MKPSKTNPSLIPQVIEVPISGADQIPSDEYVKPDSFILRNAEFSKLHKIQKRKGFEPKNVLYSDARQFVGGSTNYDEMKDIIKLGNRAESELIAITADGFLSGRSESLANNNAAVQWSRQGKISTAKIQKMCQIANYQSNQTVDGMDIDYGKGFVCIANSRKDYGNIYYQLELIVIDVATEQIVNTIVMLDNYTNSCQPKVCYDSYNGNFDVYTLLDTGVIKRHRIYVDSIHSGWQFTTLSTLTDVITAFDIVYVKEGYCLTDPGTDYIIVYRTNTGTANSLFFASILNDTATKKSSISSACADCLPSIAVAWSQFTPTNYVVFAVAWVTTTNEVKVKPFKVLNQTFTSRTIIGTSDYTTAVNANIPRVSLSVYDAVPTASAQENYVLQYCLSNNLTTGTGLYTHHCTINCTSSGVTASSEVTVPNSFVSHHGYSYSSEFSSHRFYTILQSERPDSIQCTGVLVDLFGQQVSPRYLYSAPSPMATMGQGTFTIGTNTNVKSRMPKIVGVPSISTVQSSKQTVNFYTVILEKANNVARTYGSIVSLYKIDHSLNVDIIKNEQAAILSGGIPYVYDGLNAFEAGYIKFPQLTLLSQTAGTATTGFPNQAVLYYKAIYEYIDASGKKHRSAPSNELRVLISALNNYPTIQVSSISITSKPADQITIVLYRSDDNGQTYREVTSMQTAGYGGYYHASNQPTIDLVTWVDVTGSSDGSGNYNKLASEPLYTHYSLVNFCPPSAKTITTWDDRIWLGGTEDRHDIWYSKQSNPILFPGFNAALSMSVNDSGEVKALIGIEDKLLIFKDKAIFYITGSGPNDAGEGGQYSPATAISTEIGTSQPSSVCKTPDGVFFRSSRGFELIQGGQITFVGEAVKDIIKQYPVVNDSMYSLTKKTVYFVLSNVLDPSLDNPSLSIKCIILFFDLTNKAWGYWEAPKYFPDSFQFNINSITSLYYNNNEDLYLGTGDATVVNPGAQSYVSKRGVVLEQKVNPTSDIYWLYRDTFNSLNKPYQFSMETPYIKAQYVNGAQRCWYAIFDLAHGHIDPNNANIGYLKADVLTNFNVEVTQTVNLQTVYSSTNKIKRETGFADCLFRIHVKDQKARSHKFVLYEGETFMSDPINDIPGLAVSTIKLEVGIDQSKTSMSDNRKV